MGNFAKYDISYHIQVSDNNIYKKIESCLIEEGLLHIDSKEEASVCILDASLYFANKADFDEKYEICLKILSKEDYLNYYEDLFDGGPNFILRSEFSPEEFSKSILAIGEYLDNKFQNQILQRVFDSANNSLVITDGNGVIQYANQYFLSATGYENDEVLGGLPKLIKSDFHNEAFYKDLWDTISAGRVWTGYFVNKRKDGRLFYEEATISPIFNSLGQVKDYLKIGKLVEREHILTKELSHDMKMAKEVMKYILPADYSDKCLSFKSKVKPYNYLGGDFVSFQRISDSKYAIAILDTIGHGMSSNIIGMKAVSIFQSLIQYDSLENTVRQVNQAITSINDFDLSSVHYLSGIFMVIDMEEKILSYVNAGHPAFYGKNHEGLVKFESNNMILGIVNKKNIVVESLSLEDISYIFLYSDGLIENGGKGLKESECILEEALLRAEKDPGAFMDSVLNTMIGNGEYSDDITLSYIELHRV